jgi:hypothetical protein
LSGRVDVTEDFGNLTSTSFLEIMQVHSKYISDNESGFLIDQRHIYNNKSKTQKMGMVKKGHPLVQRIGYDEKLKKIYIFFCTDTPDINHKKEQKDSI